MKITFCGATERVTGSNFLVDTGEIKFLVDCGIFQGAFEDTKENWNDFPYDPKEIDFVLITHSHLDHIGRLPILYKKGFTGKVFSTPPTKDFCSIFLRDNYNIMMEFAQNNGLELLYDEQDIENVVSLFETYDYYKEFSPIDGVQIKFFDAGHILGSAIIQIVLDGKTLVFSGDLGNPPVPILRDTDFIEKADYLIMESTYGNKIHAPFEDRRLKLERVIEESAAKGGALLIPAFAMERTQELVYEINELIASSKISKIPVYIDSPLALKATEIYKKYPKYFDSEALQLLKKGKDFFNFPELKFINSIEESKEIDQDSSNKIIIAGAGMSTGGRIIYHEKRYLPEPSTVLLLVSFQVKGTLGRKLAEHAKEVEIKGERVPVNAQIEIIDSYSAHADQARLKYWVSKFLSKPKKIFLVHGEPESSDALLHIIEDEEGIETVIPKFKETINLSN